VSTESPDELTDTTTKSSHLRWVCGFGVIAVAFAAYANTLSHEFVWDDASSILLHEDVQTPSRIGHLFTQDQHAFGRGQGNFYRPLLSVTFMLDYGFATGFAFEHESPETLSTLPFHFSSIAWHAAAAFLLWALALRLGASLGLATAVAAIYAAHPLHSEAVAYISGRADSMSATFLFAGLLAGLLRGNPLRAGILAAFCFAGGLLSKESSLVFPLLLAICLRLGGNWRDESTAPFLVRRIGPALGVLGIYILLRSTVLSFGSDSTPPTSTFAERIVETLQALALYMELTAYPAHLHMERTLEGATTGTAIWGAVALAVLVLLFAWGLIAKKRLVAIGAAWFIVTWLPISGIFPLNAPMAEHWMYVPLAGLLFAVLGALESALQRTQAAPTFRKLAAVAVAGLVAWFGSLTITRNLDWRDNASLYAATLRENPASIRVHYNLAVTYEDLIGNLPGAQRHYRMVLSLYELQRQSTPGSPMRRWENELESHISLGLIYLEQREYSRAAHHFQEVVRIEPNQRNRRTIGTAAYGLSECMQRMGRFQEAMQYREMAVRLRPDLAAP
jgi:protein O-mannosyl-transferase